ncbi:hypothetical protein BH11ACT6_BH11ACT6_57640 [soil metagenome]
MVAISAPQTSIPRTLGTQASVAWLRRFARTTPGVLGIVAAVIAAACVITGVVIGGQLDSRIAQSNAVLDHAEPLAYASQNLYAALSAADAAAASAFLSGGVETAPVRARYRQALADAAAALTDVTAGATDAETRSAAAKTSAELSAYTGLVESARANNRQGFPIGSAYLREASSLMQTSMLPSAQKIYTDKLAALDSDQRAVSSLPVVGLVLLVIVLAAIGVGSAIASARTNRTLNLGLVVAGAIVLAVIGWTVAATQLAAGAIDGSRTEGTARFEELAKARILAQQARTDETLQLIARGDITAGEEAFNSHIGDLGAALEAGPVEALDGVRQWNVSHRRQVEAYLGGDYPGAVQQAISGDPAGSEAQFNIVDASVRAEIEQTRATLRDRVSTAGDFLAWSPTGTLVLMVLAAAGTVVGLWPRLKEFL